MKCTVKAVVEQKHQWDSGADLEGRVLLLLTYHQCLL